MGLPIGDAVTQLSAGRTLSLQGAKRDGTAAAEQPAQLGFRQNTQPEVRAGFGKGTLSPGGAALRALDYSLKRARSMVPTMEEVREQVGARRAELEAARKPAAETIAVRFNEPETERSNLIRATVRDAYQTENQNGFPRVEQMARGAMTPQQMLDILA